MTHYEKMLLELMVGAGLHLGSYFTVQVSKDGGWTRLRTGDEKWPHSGCILNVEPMKLAVGFVGGYGKKMSQV